MVTQTDLLRWLIDLRDEIHPLALTQLLSIRLNDLEGHLMKRRLETDPNQVQKPQVGTRVGWGKGLYGASHKMITVPDTFSAIAGFRCYKYIYIYLYIPIY